MKLKQVNMIGGIEEPDSGTITVDGFDVTGKGRKCKYFSDVVMSVLHDLNLQGKTVIVVTHDEDIVSRTDNRVFI